MQETTEKNIKLSSSRISIPLESNFPIDKDVKLAIVAECVQTRLSSRQNGEMIKDYILKVREYEIIE